jgi:hypothetical protein
LNVRFTAGVVLLYDFSGRPKDTRLHYLEIEE